MAGLWYYSKAGSSEKIGPVGEDEFRQLVAQGQITPSDLVWTEGMPDWATLGSLSKSSAAPAMPTTQAPSPTSPLAPPGLIGWMTLVGVVHVILGILSILTCFGIISGIPMLLSGTALLSARGMLQSGAVDLPAFMTKLRTFIQMMGIVYIISFVSFLIGLVFFFGSFSHALSQAF